MNFFGARVSVAPGEFLEQRLAVGGLVIELQGFHVVRTGVRTYVPFCRSMALVPSADTPDSEKS
jgi:hypothetical protein